MVYQGFTELEREARLLPEPMDRSERLNHTELVCGTGEPREVRNEYRLRLLVASVDICCNARS